MNKRFLRVVSLCLLLLCWIPPVSAAAQKQEIWFPDFSKVIRNEERREYVETMVGYHLYTNPEIQQTLKEGYSAVFFFEGASDNMDDPKLKDISYYRVSAVCLAIRLNAQGRPYLSYLNMDCSTLPDRPLEYGAWNIDQVGAVGPATVCDGTYELFSVKHGGIYEALHIRTNEADGTLPAVYMKEGGYVTSRADMINIHTRNVNHTIEGAMWSAGCMLVGAGEFGMFTELMDSTYYVVYDEFRIGDRVGTITVDRQLLKKDLYELYGNRNAVDLLLAYSRNHHPETYFRRCGDPTPLKSPQTRWAGKDTVLMSLPCSEATDIRSVPVEQVSEGEPLEIVGTIDNSAGNTWYQVNRNGRICYIYSGYAVALSWFEQVASGLSGG